MVLTSWRVAGQKAWKNPMVRWWLVGIGAMVANIALLDWFKVGLGMALSLATVLSAELVTLVRYGILDLWVFSNRRLSWRRCGEYHVANASGFVLWSFLVVGLGKGLGWDHRIAGVAATGITVGWSLATNFLWVWRKSGKSS